MRCARPPLARCRRGAFATGGSSRIFRQTETYRHHWGRTITAGEAVMFTTWTMNANPLYFNAVYARRQGYREMPVNPMLVLNVVFGLTVEDLSEQALAHLGYWNVRFLRPVYAGDTLSAASEVLDIRESSSKPDRGIVHVRTTGTNQDGETVLQYERRILVKKRSHYSADATPTQAPGAAV